MSYDAIVLAGGASARLGGADKTRLRVGERTLLDRVLAACSTAQRTIVVGPVRPVARSVTWVREEPVGSGPAAAVGAALPLANDASVALLAADLPFLTTEAIDELLKRHASEQTPGVVALDETGREQWLISVWRTTELRAVRFVPGGSLRAVLAPLQPARVSIGGRTGMDCDTRQDLQRARELA